MADKEGSTSSSRASSAPIRPMIMLPHRSSAESLFTGWSGASPGPMTLVSNFFSENDPDSECRSFSQLLAGAMASPASIPSLRPPSFPPPPESKDKEYGGGSGGDADFRFKQSRPSGLMIAQSPMFTIPPGLSPGSLFDSPGWFSPGQGHLGMSHQQALAQVTAQAAQAHSSQMLIQAEFPSSLSAAPAVSLPHESSFTSFTTHQQMPISMAGPSNMKDLSDFSHSDQRLPQSSLMVDKPAEDGYNWRKYGQKQVKGSEYPRSYYKCTHPNCPVKKKVERSHDGQVTEIIYKGQHNHQPPQPNKRAKDMGSGNGNSNSMGNSELSLECKAGNLNRSREGVASFLLSIRDQESSQATQEHLSGSSDSEEAGDEETRIHERDEDEPDAKRRNTEVRISEPAASHRTVTEPRIIVQTTSEVDILDDGYRWRKYGQKVVKRNPYPRSYYKCTNQSCNVRKHVERAASDPKAVITTYEGKHNHDVPAARNSSHNTANNPASQLLPQSNVSDHQNLMRRTDSQHVAVLQFKEEQLT